MSKSTKLFITAFCVWMIGNTYQVFVHVPLMLAWGTRKIIDSFDGGIGLFLAIQVNQTPLLLTWLATGVLCALAVRAEYLAGGFKS